MRNPLPNGRLDLIRDFARAATTAPGDDGRPALEATALELLPELVAEIDRLRDARTWPRLGQRARCLLQGVRAEGGVWTTRRAWAYLAERGYPVHYRGHIRRDLDELARRGHLAERGSDHDRHYVPAHAGLPLDTGSCTTCGAPVPTREAVTTSA